METLVKIFKALGDKSRLRIVKMLQQRALCVCEITEILKLAPSTVSQHLSLLREAGLIIDRKDGKWVEYHLNSQAGNMFLVGLLPLLSYWLNNDPQIAADSRRLQTVDRKDLC
ncbi:metalloregulator ArsR/SmtB family transcription factor [candidate division KSB1 bacterium]|nr:metalloregulator ArsR/SmtB family transcription factor [candidate division KSB1 bacterium]